jgi:hypothetical protein
MEFASALRFELQHGLGGDTNACIVALKVLIRQTLRPMGDGVGAGLCGLVHDGWSPASGLAGASERLCRSGARGGGQRRGWIGCVGLCGRARVGSTFSPVSGECRGGGAGLGWTDRRGLRRAGGSPGVLDDGRQSRCCGVPRRRRRTGPGSAAARPRRARAGTGRRSRRLSAGARCHARIFGLRGPVRRVFPRRFR